MNQPLISVIVPVYNVEKYLDKCITSILDQDYQNIEIILINDGSTDKSLAICNSYIEKDKRVRLFSQKNQGLSAARNLGLQKANGEFVMFVDSDDYVEPNYCSAALSCQQKYDADIVFFDYKRVTDENEIIHSFEQASGVVTKEVAMQYLINHSYSWNKLYLKKVFNNISFPVGKYYEDLYTSYKLFEISKKIVYLKNSLYNYVETGQSIVGSKGSKQIADQFDADYQLFRFLQDNYPHVYKKYKDNLIIKSLRYCTFAGPDYDRELFNKAKDTIVTNKISKTLSLRYKLTMGLFKFYPQLALQIFKIQKYRNRSHISQNEN